jgi:hypothetical protein
MGRSRTWSVKAGTLAAQRDLAPLLARLMLSINDLSLANNGIEEWEAATEQHKAPRKVGAQMYFVRVLMGHLREALKIVFEISKSPHLRSAVDDCDETTVRDFRTVEEFVNSSEMDLVKDFRNLAAFHYDKTRPGKCLGEIAAAEPSRSWSYSMGTESLDWHFELADAIVDRMVIREVFKLTGPRGPERWRQTEKIARRHQEIARVFTSFAAHFVRHYSK